MADDKSKHLVNTDSAYPEVTQGVLDGHGLMDEIMRSVKSHLSEEYVNQRIKGSDYSKVYLGSMESALANTVQYLVQMALVPDQRAKIRADIALTEAQTKLTEAQTHRLLSLLKWEIEKIKAEVEYLKATLKDRIALIKAETELKRAQADLAKVEAEVALATKDARIELIKAQVKKIDAEIDKIMAEIELIREQFKKTESEVILIKAKQFTEAANFAQGFWTDSNGNLFIEKDSDPHNFHGVMGMQIYKTDAERRLITARQVSEAANWTDKYELDAMGNLVMKLKGPTDMKGLTYRQRQIMEKQRDGFDRDAEQKAAKIFTDVYSILRTTDEDLEIPSGMAFPNMNAMAMKLAEGLGSEFFLSNNDVYNLSNAKTRVQGQCEGVELEYNNVKSWDWNFRPQNYFEFDENDPFCINGNVGGGGSTGGGTNPNLPGAGTGGNRPGGDGGSGGSGGSGSGGDNGQTPPPDALPETDGFYDPTEADILEDLELDPEGDGLDDQGNAVPDSPVQPATSGTSKPLGHFWVYPKINHPEGDKRLYPSSHYRVGEQQYTPNSSYVHMRWTACFPNLSAARAVEVDRQKRLGMSWSLIAQQRARVDFFKVNAQGADTWLGWVFPNTTFTGPDIIARSIVAWRIEHEKQLNLLNFVTEAKANGWPLMGYGSMTYDEIIARHQNVSDCATKLYNWYQSLPAAIGADVNDFWLPPNIPQPYAYYGVIGLPDPGDLTFPQLPHMTHSGFSGFNQFSSLTGVDPAGEFYMRWTVTRTFRDFVDPVAIPRSEMNDPDNEYILRENNRIIEGRMTYELSNDFQAFVGIRQYDGIGYIGAYVGPLYKTGGNIDLNVLKQMPVTLPGAGSKFP